MTRRAVIVLRAAVALLAVLAIAIAIAHRYRNAIALEVANTALAGTGITVRRATIATLGTEQVQFADIELELDDGALLRIEDITLPVKFRGFAGTAIRAGTVTLVPGTGDAGPPALAGALRRWLDAPLALPGATVTVTELHWPGLPVIRDLSWLADPAWATLDAVIEPYVLHAASGPGADADYRASLRVLRDDGEALAADALLRFGGDAGAGIDGELALRIEPLRELLDATQALPDGIVELDASLRGTYSASVPAEPGADVAMRFELELDGGLRTTYRAQPGDPVTQVDIRETSAIEARIAYPSLRWTAAADRVVIRLGDARFGTVPATLRAVSCESGLRCRFDVTAKIGEPAAGDFAAAALDVGARAVELTAADGQWRLRTDDLRVTAVAPTWRTRAVVAPSLRGRLLATGEAVSAALRLTTPGDGLLADVGLDYAIADDRGELRVANGTLSFGSLPPSALLGQWQWPWDVRAGTAGFSGSLRFGARGASSYRGAFTLRAEGLSGHYGDVAFAGLTTSFEVDLDAAADPVLSPLDVAVDLLDIGFPIERLRATARPDLGESSAEVSGLTMSTLGGTVTAEPFRYVADAAENRIVLQLQSIQLPLIVALADLEAVNVTGSVSGTLPVALAGGKIRIDGGRLRNDAPGGAIRYRAGSTSGNDQGQLGVVMRTLRNFEYETLSSEVSYTEDGDLKLQMRLTGVNPDVDATQPVILNLGVEDNIPQLLRSLQAARSIEDILERRYSR